MDSPTWMQDQFGLMLQLTQLGPAQISLLREVITLSKVAHCSLFALYSFTLSYFSSEHLQLLDIFMYCICLPSPFSNKLHEDSFIPHCISSAK